MITVDDQALQTPLLRSDESEPGDHPTSFPTGGGGSSGRISIQRNSSVRVHNSLSMSSNTMMQTFLTSHTASSARDHHLASTVEGEEGDGSDAGTTRTTCGGKFCSLMDRFPIVFVLTGAALGIAIGIGLSAWNPADPSGKTVVIQWIGLLGELFIRSLKCIVLPLVSVSIAISVMDMLSLGETGTIVSTTIGLYVLTTVCAAIIGVVCSLTFEGFYVLMNDQENVVEPDVALECKGETSNSYLTEMDGSIVCMPLGAGTSLFRLHDINGYFAKSELAKGAPELSLSDSIYEGLFMQLISSNMAGLFVNENFLGVIVFGAGFGVALSKLSKKTPAGIKWDRIITIQVLEELLEVFMLFVMWIIKFTPFAIVSLIASAIGAHTDIGQIIQQLAWLMTAVISGMLIQFLIVYTSLYFGFARKNPFKYFSHIVPAFTMAFASSSSAATLPVSLECAKASGQVPEGVARFCLPLGATINMDSGAIPIICSCVWLAYQNGIDPTAGDYILLVFCATLGSMGTAPVPSASLVLILTSYSTTFGSSAGAPAGFPYLLAIDWLVDRLATMFNVSGDLIVTAIVANKVEKDLKAKEPIDEVGTSTILAL